MDMREISLECHEIAEAHGFWDDSRKMRAQVQQLCLPSEREAFEAMLFGQKTALIHSEISEALEAFRHGNPPDSHIPQHKGAVVELADAMIRIFDTCEEYGWGAELLQAMRAKMDYNKSRPFKHGKNS
jgi:hypothetical protein